MAIDVIKPISCQEVNDTSLGNRIIKLHLYFRYVQATIHKVAGDGEPVMNNRWVRGGCVVAAFCMVITLFVGAETAGTVAFIVPPFDKAVHFAYYGTIAALLVHGVGLRWMVVPLIMVPVIGAADEWQQSFIVGRDASFWDWMADELGTIVAVYTYWKWNKGGDAIRRSRDRRMH